MFLTDVVNLIKDISESTQVQSNESEKINLAITDISSKISVTAKLAQDLEYAISSMTIEDAGIL